MREGLLGDLRAPLLWLSLATGLVLLAACANVGSLLLARATSRRHEFAVRAAIGAGAKRIVGQVLTESAVLGAIAGGVGMCLVAWLLATLLIMAPDDLRVFHPTLGAPVLLCGMGLSIAAGLLFGCAPPLVAGRQSLVGALTTRGLDRQSGRTSRGAFLALEFAISLALLVATELLIGSFRQLRSVEPGFQPDGLQTISVALPAARYTTPDRQRLFFDALLERVHALPGVETAAAAGRLPFGGVESTRAIVIEGADTPNAWGGIRVVSPEYFCSRIHGAARAGWPPASALTCLETGNRKPERVHPDVPAPRPKIRSNAISPLDQIDDFGRSQVELSKRQVSPPLDGRLAADRGMIGRWIQLGSLGIGKETHFIGGRQAIDEGARAVGSSVKGRSTTRTSARSNQENNRSLHGVSAVP